MLLKFLAEFGCEFSLRAAASISAPIDLAAASQRFLAPRNRFYHFHLLRSMKAEALAAGANLSEEERVRVRAARSIYDFDDQFVAPRNGFRDAEHYYDENHARRFLAGISVPTAVIYALDDPWIPPDAYLEYPWVQNRSLVPLLSRRGGHVGFHDRSRGAAWYDRCLERLLDRELG
jgi:hypothetical protein